MRACDEYKKRFAIKILAYLAVADYRRSPDRLQREYHTFL
jgi:hypothetical protein